MKKVPETAYAAIVVEWLIGLGWEVYQEVPVGYGRTVDIVAIKRDPPLAWLIEVKKAFGQQLAGQVRYIESIPDLCSVAVPEPKRRSAARTQLAERFMERGIGIIYIDYPGRTLRELVVPDPAKKRQRTWRTDIERHDRLFKLAEEYKTFCVAGSQGGYLTPFKVTCNNLREHVRANPGIPLCDAVKEIDHHYSSNSGAASALGDWNVKGVQKLICLFPTEGETDEMD